MASSEKLTDAELIGLISQTTGSVLNQATQISNQNQGAANESTCTDVCNIENHEKSTFPSLGTEASPVHCVVSPELEQTFSCSQSYVKSKSSGPVSNSVQSLNKFDPNIENPVQTVRQSVSLSPVLSTVNSESQSDGILDLKDETKTNITSSTLDIIKSSLYDMQSSSLDLKSSTANLKSSSSNVELEPERVTALQCKVQSLSCSKFKTCSNNITQPLDKNSKSRLDSELDTNLSKENISKLFNECRTELEATNKKLEKSERQLQKANAYNEVLRNMVEKLSGEIHRVRNVQTCSVYVQVDKEDFLDYTTGMDTMPKWKAEDDSMKMAVDTSETPDAIVVTPATSSTQQPGAETDNISIADSIKQAAEAVVQQQQADMLQDQGYVYDDYSGLYYHPATGYYYDQHKSLFYDPKSGIYYYYDYNTGEYLFHSKIELPIQNQPTEQPNHGEQGQAQKNVSDGRNSRKLSRKMSESKRRLSNEKCYKMEDDVMSQVLCGMEDLKISPYARNARKHALELAGSYPPCIRVMVLESDYLPVGTLHIVTCTGAKLGCENCDINIPDLNVSKVHAEIQYNEGACQYEIYDHASQNGTFLNNQRLSPAKIASEPFVLSHDDSVVISSTKLLCHIHSGYDTCDLCEPGVVIASYKTQQPQNEIKVLSKEERLRLKKQELNQIKKRYGLKNSAYEDNSEVFNNPNYTDKAEERRKFVGSDVPGQKHEAPASVHRPISTGNVGHKMLQKMGWKEGDSLGKNNKGIQEPISVTLRASQKAGLGSANAGAFSADDANTVDMKKASRRLQAQQRFKKIEANSDQEKTVSNKLWTQGETEFT